MEVDKTSFSPMLPARLIAEYLQTAATNRLGPRRRSARLVIQAIRNKSTILDRKPKTRTVVAATATGEAICDKSTMPVHMSDSMCTNTTLVSAEIELLFADYLESIANSLTAKST